mmetsp:Transcript_18923/g.47791  ORF Transcript_18923/g.47791 Transcript_18923/m.47791 type:complete len:464 (-) Transcript_18923:117-1508(-)
MVSPFVVVGTLVSAPSYGELACDRGRAVAVDSAGRIAGVGDADAASLARLCDLVGCDSAEGVLVLPDGHALCPGFIDIHIHAPQFSYTGTATDKPLMDWLEHYTFPSEARLGADLHEAREVYAGVVHQTLRQGTTTAMYFATVHQEPCTVLLEVLDQLGQRALVGKVCQDRNSSDGVLETTEGSLHATEAFIQHIRRLEGGQAGRLHPVITPRFVPTCSPSLLSGLGELAAKYDVHVQSHISESKDQVAFVEALHPGERDTQIFASSGLLTHKAVMAHGTQLTESELKQLAAAGTALAHCPLSNFFFGDGLLSVAQCRRLGVKVGLGTDVAGGYSPSMLSAIRNAVITHKVLAMQSPGSRDQPAAEKGAELDYRHAFWLATRGSAEALGLQDDIGSLEIGKKFDVLQLDLGAYSGTPYQVFERDSDLDKMQKWVNLADDRSIRRVWVDGRLVVPFSGHTSGPS